MQNEKKEYVDSYIPRKCFATNKILNAKDKASIQVNFSTEKLQEKTNKNLTVVLSGFCRAKGQSDAAINRYLKQQGLLSFE